MVSNMHNYFIFDIKHVDEDACRRDASYLYKQRNVKSMIHHHAYKATCNPLCYLYPLEPGKIRLPNGSIVDADRE